MDNISSVQLLSRVWLFVTPWTAAPQASLSITNSQSPPKLMSMSRWCQPIFCTFPSHLLKLGFWTTEHISVPTEIQIHRFGVDYQHVRESECSGSWWWTGRPGMLRFMGSQRVGHNWATELNWVFHCMYVPHLLYPFICRLIFRFLLCLGYCK